MDKGSQRTTVRRAAPRPRRAPNHEHDAPGDTSSAPTPTSTTPLTPSTTHPKEANGTPPQSHASHHPPPGDTSTLHLAKHLTDPAIEAEIQAFIATAPPIPEETRARLARMLGTKHCHRRDT